MQEDFGELLDKLNGNIADLEGAIQFIKTNSKSKAKAKAAPTK